MLWLRTFDQDMTGQSNIIKVSKFSEENGFFTTPNKSSVMRKIKSRDNQSEQALRKMLWGLGIRYRKNDARLPGKPDIVIPRAKLVIFIDGEFWHGHNWETNRHKIKANRDYWIPKIERNMQRDNYNNIALNMAGWTVLRFWERQIIKEFGVCVRIILEHIE